ncbi:hypothetical protein AB205_0030530 [Aquarana catesbeiana]|uniref:MADF domain-containing protein n=1 Tax=Aquarana catesbeiana TaxID=8400 RepID=A0A2G9RCM8_AQUCT|nr:hypothetical protein AB205_0030530 [Aquarana catesbeiana]
MEKLLELVKPVYLTADINYLKAKIRSLRSTYNRECKKVRDSQRSGAAADDIYVPRLWYYHSLRFLSDQSEPHPSFSTLPSTSGEAPEVHPGPLTKEEDVEEPSLTQESLSQEEAVPSNQTESQVPPLRPPTKRARKWRNLDEAMAAFLRHATSAISMAPDAQEAFGCMTGNKLKEMEEDQRSMCEEIILQQLNKGRRGQITPKMHICKIDHTPALPPPTPQPPHPAQQHGGPWPMQPQHPQRGCWAGDNQQYHL